MKAYAVNTVHRRPDKEKPVQVVKAGSVFEVDQKEFDELSKLGAVTKATAAQIAAAKEAENRANGMDEASIAERTRTAETTGATTAVATPVKTEEEEPAASRSETTRTTGRRGGRRLSNDDI